MSNKIQWKESKIDYDNLNQLTYKKIVQIQNGKNQGKVNAENGTVITAGKAAAIKNVKSGQLDYIRQLDKTKKAQSIVGKKQGKINAKNGHLDKIRVDGGKVAGRLTVESGRIKEMQKLAIEKTSKKIIATRIKDNKKFEFKSLCEAARQLNCCHGNISKHLKGIGKSVAGYTFKLK